MGTQVFAAGLFVTSLATAACAKQATQSQAPQPCPVEASTLAPVTPLDAAATAEALAELRLQRADAISARARELFDVPGMSVGVVVGDELVFAKGYGEKELGKGQAVDAQTSFAIASNTKAFTATAVGMLVAEGKLSWDDRVVDHLPDFELWDPYVTRELRVRDLLSHRVGLDTWAGDLMWISSNFDRATVMKRLKHLPARWGLREHYGYCNLMFMVAGVLIEKVSGQPWDAYLRERLLDPLGMKQVATRVGQLEGRTNVATAHIQVDGEWQTTPYLDLATIGPAASFHANIEDLSRWVRMQLHDGKLGDAQVVPSQVIRETRQPHMFTHLGEQDFYEPRRHLSGYGLGWYVADYRGELMVWHGGGMPGMTSRVLMFPESDVGVVVLTSSESGVSSALALELADLWLTEPNAEGAWSNKDYLADMHARSESAAATAKPKAPALTGDPPKGLAGKWNNPVLGAATIAVEADGSYFSVPGHGGLRCRLYGGTGDRPTSIPCAWEDPNMGISEFALGYKGKRVRSLAFKVRPDFYDPLTYTFTR